MIMKQYLRQDLLKHRLLQKKWQIPWLYLNQKFLLSKVVRQTTIFATHITNKEPTAKMYKKTYKKKRPLKILGNTSIHKRGTWVASTNQHVHAHTRTQKRVNSNQRMQEWRQHHGGVKGLHCLPHREHWFRQSHIDKRAFVKVWEFSGDVPAHRWAQGSRNGRTEEGKNVSLCSHHLVHKAAELGAKRDLLGPWFFPWGKIRAYEWVPGFPSCMGMLPSRPTSLSPHPEHWDVLHTWGDWVQGRGRRMPHRAVGGH